MGASRFHFADDEKTKRDEPKVWVTRMIVTSVVVGLAGAAHLLLGFRFF